MAIEINEARPLGGRADYVLVFDGGSEGNPGFGYGSYMLNRRGGPPQTVRLEFGQGVTNNEAEYDSLIAGLRDLIGRITAARRDPAEFSVQVRGDSRLVISQVNGEWKAKAPRMRVRRNEARNLLQRFAAYELVWQPREESVRLLGH